jgi:hypothetical protein
MMFASPWHSTIPDFLLTAIVAGACVGVPQAFFVAVVHHRWRDPDMELVFMGMLAVGAVGAIDAVASALRLPHGRWVQVASPPERLVELLGPVCVGSVYVPVYGRAENGSYLRYDRYPAGRWIRVTSVPAPRNPMFGPCVLDREEHVPSPPRGVIDVVHVDSRGADYASHWHIALYNNGDVRVWNERFGVLGSMGRPIAYVLSLCLSVVAFVGVWRRWREPRTVVAPTP